MTIPQILTLTVLLAVAVLFPNLFRKDRSTTRFHSDFEIATRKDMKYAETHPGCTLEEAHRERDNVLRKYGKG